MIFQHTWQQVLDGTKTQTRRLVKPGEWVGYIGKDVLSGTGRTVYEVGKTYAVQPGRGQAAVGRIRITSIRQEDVRQISKADALAEGFSGPLEFLRVWCGMHDPAAIKQAGSAGDYLQIGDRPAERYQAWALTFEVV